ncbi:MAG: hypothetical protein SCJ97_05180 [Bacillota bacterium]|nr:hypothetical protein [Bacillota bacterium]
MQHFERTKYYLLIFIFAILLTAANASTEASETLKEGEGEILYYFWGHCPVCSKPEDHVGLFEDYPVTVEIYEVFYDQDGRAIYDQKRNELGIEIFGFPTVVFGDRYWIGFSEVNQNDILATIEASLSAESEESEINTVRFPMIGEINLETTPILLTTVIIASLDGFNPCSLFVLTFLLAIIVHSASRRRIFAVGLTFLIVTAAVYGLFMLGVLNIMIFVGQLFWIRNIVAAIVIILGLVSIKDFFWFKEGISFSIPDSYKSKFYKQVRNIFYTKSFIPMVLATVVMALGISLVEIPCTAGFPFIWSSIISRMDLSITQFALLFVLYIFLYLLIELIIFAVAMIRMRAVKLTEERGRLLKLAAGCLMLVLGFILLVKPDYMENIVGLTATFAASTALIIILYYCQKIFSKKS